MKNKYLAILAVVVALFLQSCAHSYYGPSTVTIGNGGGYSSPGGWVNGGFSIGPRQQCSQPYRQVANSPRVVRGQQQTWNQVCQPQRGYQPQLQGYQQQRYQQQYPQQRQPYAGSRPGQGMGPGFANWLSGNGRSLDNPPVHYNEGTSQYTFNVEILPVPWFTRLKGWLGSDES